jgi:hypothetical protein
MFQLDLDFELDVLDTELKSVHKVFFELFDHGRSGLLGADKFTGEVLDQALSSFVSEVVIELVF